MHALHEDPEPMSFLMKYAVSTPQEHGDDHPIVFRRNIPSTVFRRHTPVHVRRRVGSQG